MYDLRFDSDDPLDHLPRALDQLRRASMTLHSADVETGEDGGGRIHVRFTACAEGTAETFGHRVAGMIGISGLNLTRANA